MTNRFSIHSPETAPEASKPFLEQTQKTDDDGRRVEVGDCDVFTFRDGKIIAKNSYRKIRPLIE